MPMVRVEIHSCSIYLLKKSVFQCEKFRHCKVECRVQLYILKDFSEEKKIVTCSLENGSCEK